MKKTVALMKRIPSALGGTDLSYRRGVFIARIVTKIPTFRINSTTVLITFIDGTSE